MKVAKPHLKGDFVNARLLYHKIGWIRTCHCVKYCGNGYAPRNFYRNQTLSSKLSSVRERTRSIHDYRLQKIRDVKFREMYTYLILKKRRYKCTSCGKRFYERYPFLERYQRHTKRVLQALLIKVRTANFKEVAKELGLGHSTVIRWFDRYYTYENHSLPQILAIDEFKGTTEKGKYQCVIGDPRGFKVFDVIQDRKLSTLKDYFRSLPTHRVQMVVMDMWQPYKILAQQLFQNPTVTSAFTVRDFHPIDYTHAGRTTKNSLSECLASYR
jgi:transposase